MTRLAPASSTTLPVTLTKSRVQVALAGTSGSPVIVVTVDAGPIAPVHSVMWVPEAAHAAGGPQNMAAAASASASMDIFRIRFSPFRTSFLLDRQVRYIVILAFCIGAHGARLAGYPAKAGPFFGHPTGQFS